MDAAVTQLKAYAKTFGTTMNSVNDNLPADVVEAAIVHARHHAPGRHRRPEGR